MSPRILGIAWLIATYACTSTSAPDVGEDTGEDARGDADAEDTHEADSRVAPMPMVPPEPEEFARCPGGEGCPEGNDGLLLAGAARVEITPNLDDYDTFTDLNGNSTFDRDEPFEDRNGNGVFDGAWIAGFGTARGAEAIHDPVYSTALVLRNGDITIAMVSLDLVGWFLDENEQIRESLVESLGDGAVDLLVVSSTHTHEGPDTVGIWGRTINDSGVYPEYQALVRERTVQAIEQAIDTLEPANLEQVMFRLRDVDFDRDGTPDDDVNRWVGDNRHPNIVDDEVRVMRFVRAGTATEEPGSGETISTFVNFAAHPEYTGSENRAISSDFPHWLRLGIEDGVAEDDRFAPPIAGLGGITLFINGALGVQIGPNRIHLMDNEGVPLNRGSFDAAACLGTQLGWMVNGALRGEQSARPESLESGALGFRTRRFYTLVENVRYHFAGTNGIFQRAQYYYDPDRRISARTGNLPWARTEVAVFDIGPATLLTIPGELDPAEFVGGYDAPCDYTPGGCDALINEALENLPALDEAPEGPFLRTRLLSARDDAQSAWLLGSAMDYLGYFIPEFDFELHAGAPYLGEAPGQHYEETNAVGEQSWPAMLRIIDELIDDTDE